MTSSSPLAGRGDLPPNPEGHGRDVSQQPNHNQATRSKLSVANSPPDVPTVICGAPSGAALCEHEHPLADGHEHCNADEHPPLSAEPPTNSHAHHHSHGHAHMTSHDHGHNHGHGHDHDHVPDHAHDHGLGHDHAHDHLHGDCEDHDHDHDDCCSHDHDHDHDDWSDTAAQASDCGKVLCKCCVDRMFGYNAMVSFKDILARISIETERIRQCCLALAGACCPGRTETCCQGKDSCESDESERLLKDMTPSRTEVTKTKERSLRSVGDKEVFGIEVTGLHCADCMAKVRRAAERLDGVRVVSLDGIRGTAQIQSHPDLHTPDSIARFIAKATGYTVTLTRRLDQDDDKTFDLPISLDTMPPAHILEGFEYTKVSQQPSGVMIEFTVRPDRQGSQLPRELMRRLAPFHPTLAADQDPARNRIKRDLYNIFMRTTACAVLTIPLLVLVWAQLPNRGSIEYRAGELALASAIVALAWPMYREAILLFWYLREVDLGLLVAVSTLTAYIFSVIAFAFQAAGKHFSEPFFETVGLLITLIYVGRTLQVAVRSFTATTLFSMASLQPKTARIATANQGEEEIDFRLLHLGDSVTLGADDIVPTDGLVIKGRAEVDESAVTGESVPVVKEVGRIVAAGTRVVEGELVFSVTHQVANNSISAMRKAVEAAQTSNGRYADLADRFAAYLLPIAMAASTISFLIWMFISHYLRSSPWTEAVITGLKYGIAVLAVSCPCALALAVSSVTSVTLAMGIREGVVFRSPDALRQVGGIDMLAFDKTGTLSQNKLAVVEADAAPNAAELTHQLTLSIKHPISVAVHEYTSGIPEEDEDVYLSEVTSITGGGMSSTFLGAPLLGGSPAFTNTTHHPKVAPLLESGFSLFIVTLDSRLIAVYSLSDIARPDAADALRHLHDRGKDVAIISGDNKAAVERFASLFNLAPNDIYGGCSPTGKGDIIDTLKIKHTVAFIGDGVNDSIALSKADVSVSIGSGTDAAIAASSIVFLGSDLGRMVGTMFDLSKNFNIHAILALTWCGVYFTFAILLAGGAFVNWSIPPSYAGLGEVVSVLPVLFIAGSTYVSRQVQVWRQGKRVES